MHLGFTYSTWVFKALNSEAAQPMVFTTTLLLITIIALLTWPPSGSAPASAAAL